MVRKRRRRRVRQHRGHRADPECRADHPWLAGVRGAEENPYVPDANGDLVIAPYAGHGTFVAGVLRCMAPKASVFVERAFNIAAADYETNLASSLENALDRDPDILVFTFTSSTHRDQSLHTFDDFYERRIRQMKGLVRARARGQRRAGHARCGRPPIPGSSPSVPWLRTGGIGRRSPTTAGGSMSTRREKTSSTPSPREPTCATSLPTVTNAGISTGWPTGAGHRSARRWSPG